MSNYSDATEAAAMCGKAAADIRPAWQNAVDARIESFAHQGYKGAARTYQWVGEGNSLLALPSIAATITSITEDGRVMDVSEYGHLGPSRVVERKGMTSLYPYYYAGFSRTGCWYKNSLYIVTYVEPATPPDDWKDTANYCVSLYAMFADKFSEDGIALTHSDQGQAGGRGGNVSSGGATSFPASMLEEIKRAIRDGIKRVGI